MSDSDYSDDKKVRKIDSDIMKFQQELQQAESELAGIGTRLDGEIERLRTDAKSKLDSYEGLRKRVREAEATWKDADKRYKKASGGRDNEVSNARKRVEVLQKRSQVFIHRKLDVLTVWCCPGHGVEMWDKGVILDRVHIQAETEWQQPDDIFKTQVGIHHACQFAPE